VQPKVESQVVKNYLELWIFQARDFLWSGRRGSNSRHSAWEADALPTELLPHQSEFSDLNVFVQVQKKNLERKNTRETWWAGMDSNHRTLCERIYSPSPLTTRTPTQGVTSFNARTFGATHRNRTDNLPITNRVLYRIELEWQKTVKSRTVSCSV
jgi:hypothetical protein